VPTEYNGIGASKLTFCIITEELAKVSLSCCGIITGQELGLTPILLAGNDEQKKAYFPKIATGDYITAFALTEPGAGSDSVATSAKATLRGEYYVVNGDKCFIVTVILLMCSLFLLKQI